MYDYRRAASGSVKFKDAELIGIPIIVVVGQSLIDGKVEIRIRRSGERSEVLLETAVGTILNHM